MHWTDRYVGEPYIDGVKDCAWLVTTVNKEVFDREIPIPSERETHFLAQTVQINQQLEDSFEKIDMKDAVEGDVVLMICRGRLSHTGVLAYFGRTPYVLHNVKSIGSVVLQKLTDLPNICLQFEGIYRYKEVMQAGLDK
jgi:hypothetical protein